MPRPLIGVVNGDRQFSLCGQVRIAHEACDRDEPVGAIAFGLDQRDVVVSVDLREMCQLALSEAVLGSVEATVVDGG